MKKLMIVALAIGLGSAVSAQNVALSATPAKTEKKETVTPEQRAERMTQKQTEMLKLTEEQQKKAYQINLDRAIEMDRTKAQRDEVKNRAEEVDARSDKRMEEILNADQKKVWSEKRAEMGERKTERQMEHKASRTSEAPAGKSTEAGKACCAGKEEGKSCSDKKAEEKK